VTTFNREYFDRFYGSRRTRVHGAAEIGHLCRAVVELCAHFGGELESVLEVGAGPGLWRDWFRRHRPAVRYRSTDASAYACERYGHERRDIARWRSRERYDLVVCQGVLPYLDDEACAAAVANLAAMSRGFLYLEAPTARDLAEVCDEQSDFTMRGRRASFYRRLLAPHYLTLGCGLFYVRDGGIHFYELELG
jgi:hypothetical protein